MHTGCTLYACLYTYFGHYCSIYVDTVVNHMASATYSGVGSGGSSYNAGNGHFPAVPYGSGDFNGCGGVCSDNFCDINNYNDPVEVSNISFFAWLGNRFFVFT